MMSNQLPAVPSLVINTYSLMQIKAKTYQLYQGDPRSTPLQKHDVSCFNSRSKYSKSKTTLLAHLTKQKTNLLDRFAVLVIKFGYQ